MHIFDVPGLCVQYEDFRIHNKPSLQFTQSEVPDKINCASHLTCYSIVMDFKSCGGLMCIFEKRRDFSVFPNFATAPAQLPFSGESLEDLLGGRFQEFTTNQVFNLHSQKCLIKSIVLVT